MSGKLLYLGPLLLVIAGCQMKNNNQSATLDATPIPVVVPAVVRLVDEPITIRFSPTGDIRTGVVGVLAKATKSADAAIYSLGDKATIKALSDLGAAGVQVRLLLNKPGGKCKILPPGQPSANNFCDKLEDSGVDVRFVTPVMHHKFAVVDGGQSGGFANVAVMTGSANWSNTAFGVFDEDWLEYLGDSDLARDFQTEFNYIWDHAIDYPGATQAQPSLAFQPSTAKHVFFTSANTKKRTQAGSFSWDPNGSAVSNQIVTAIDGAVVSVKIAHAHFRTPAIYEAVKRAHERGVVVKIVLDQQEYRPGSQASSNLFFDELLARQNVDVRYKVYSVKWNHVTAKQLHSKFSIIDDKTVMTGSYNWSENAESNTFENMVVVTDLTAVQNYITQFDVISNYRAGEFDGLISALTASHLPADCHMNPMTMTAKEFDRWRNVFPSTECK